MKHTGWNFTDIESRIVNPLIYREYFLIYIFSITGAILEWHLYLLESAEIWLLY